MSIAERVRGNKPVEIHFSSLAQAAAVEQLRSRTEILYSRDEDRPSHSEPVGVSLNLSGLTAYLNDKTDKDALLSWLNDNDIGFDLKGKDGETLDEMKRKGTELGSTSHYVTVDVTDLDAIRKLAVAGFEFKGAQTLRDNQAHLTQLQGVKRSGLASN